MTDFIPGVAKAAAKAAGATPDTLFMVPIDEIVVDPDFNVRIHDDQYETHIERITDSILSNGFYKTSALAGYVGKRNQEDVIILVGGFSRLEAAKRAIARGAPIEELPIILKPTGTNEADLTLSLAMDNTGAPLRPYEKATVVKRLSSFGWTERKIATRLGVSQSYVNSLLYLTGLPQDLQQLVIDDRISAGHAVEMARKHGPQEALDLMRADLVIYDKPADDDEKVLDAPAPVPVRAVRRQPRKPGMITSRVCLAAIDYTIQQEDLDFLSRWRGGDREAIAVVEDTLKRVKHDL